MDVKCLIVDDEPPARELIRSYLERLDGFTVCGEFPNAMDGFNYLQKNNVDLLFVDIQMPKMDGIELIRSLVKRPKIIITTAFRDYAAEGFDLSILDYLVKPIVFDRFLNAIGKYNQCILTEREPNSSYEDTYMFFRVEKEMVKIYLRDIVYIESIQDYIKINTPERTYVTYTRIGYMDEKLPDSHFVRIHKSFIVPLGKVASYTHNTVKVNGKQLPIGRVYKQGFLNAIDQSRFNV